MEPQTPPNKSRFPSADDWPSPIPFPSASIAPSIPSPKNQDLQEAIDSYKREMFEVTGHEQTVNACLIDLIIPVASMLGSSGRVRFDRKPFQVLKKNATDGKALYEAQVDGLIMGRDSNDVQALMEAKRDLRAVKQDVRLQEGAQMAAFVYSKGRTTKETSKQWMISMDGYEGYITVATYDKRYVDFLYDDLVTEKTSFMVMHEYGPFDLRTCETTEVHGLESFLKAIAVLMEL